DVVCASRRSALSAVRFIGEGVPLTLGALEMQAVHAVFVATPDDRIEQAAEWTAERLSPRKARAAVHTVALHTSGAGSSAGIGALGRAGFAIGSCHPLQTFESPRRALESIPESYFCIEGEARAARFARGLVRRIGGRSFEIPTAAKPLYHAAAVMASG